MSTWAGGVLAQHAHHVLGEALRVVRADAQKVGLEWGLLELAQERLDHSNALESRLIQTNSTRRSGPSLFFCWQCQIFFRIDANGVTPMPVCGCC